MEEKIHIQGKSRNQYSVSSFHTNKRCDYILTIWTGKKCMTSSLSFKLKIFISLEIQELITSEIRLLHFLLGNLALQFYNYSSFISRNFQYQSLHYILSRNIVSSDHYFWLTQPLSQNSNPFLIWSRLDCIHQ